MHYCSQNALLLYHVFAFEKSAALRKCVYLSVSVWQGMRESG